MWHRHGSAEDLDIHSGRPLLRPGRSDADVTIAARRSHGRRRRGTRHHRRSGRFQWQGVRESTSTLVGGDGLRQNGRVRFFTTGSLRAGLLQSGVEEVKRYSLRLTVFVVSFTMGCLLSYGQISSTAPLSGVVSDPSGAVIPGASITVKNNATSAQFGTISIENGTFIIPALIPGVYTVTVTLPGFKRAVVPDVKIDAGTPATVRVTLPRLPTAIRPELGSVFILSRAKVNADNATRQRTPVWPLRRDRAVLPRD